MNEKEKLFSMETPITEKSVATAHHGKRRHFTVLDLGIIIILVLSVLGIGFRSMIADWIMKSTPEEKVIISFQAEGVTAEQLSCMDRDRALSLSGQSFGILQSYESTVGKIVVEQKKSDGTVEFVTVDDPNSFTVTGTVEVDGRYTDGGFVCQENVNLYVGKVLKIDSASYTITVLITEIPRK